MKTAVVLGVCGGLRVSEIAALTFDDICFENGYFKVIVRRSKTDQAGVGHQFYVSPSANKSRCFCDLIQRYINSFTDKQKTDRFFRKLGANGKATDRPIGVNTIGKYPKMVADALGLIGNFTGHCFRRSSATIAADAGADLLALKRHGRWSSDTVAEEYVADSKQCKMQMANIFSDGQEAHSSSMSEGITFNNVTFNNCIINFRH